VSVEVLSLAQECILPDVYPLCSSQLSSVFIRMPGSRTRVGDIAGDGAAYSR